jgi:pentatricopeptide repeat protein
MKCIKENLQNAAFWNVMLCGFCKNRHFGGMYRLHHQGDKNSELGMLAVTGTEVRSMLQLLVTANVPPKHWFLQEPPSVTSQKMAFFSHHHENLKSYKPHAVQQFLGKLTSGNPSMQGRTPFMNSLGINGFEH